MYVSKHVIFGGIFSSSLFLIFPQLGLFGATIIFLSSVLIDVDHYLYYLYVKRDWNLMRAYNWFLKVEKEFLKIPRKQRAEIYLGFCFLHGMEVLIALFFLGIFVHKLFFFIFVGVAFHLLLDIVEGTIYFDRVDKFSLLKDFFKIKKLKKIH